MRPGCARLHRLTIGAQDTILPHICLAAKLNEHAEVGDPPSSLLQRGARRERSGASVLQPYRLDEPGLDRRKHLRDGP